MIPTSKEETVSTGSCPPANSTSQTFNHPSARQTNSKTFCSVIVRSRSGLLLLTTTIATILMTITTITFVGVAANSDLLREQQQSQQHHQLHSHHHHHHQHSSHSQSSQHQQHQQPQQQHHHHRPCAAATSKSMVGCGFSLSHSTNSDINSQLTSGSGSNSVSGSAPSLSSAGPSSSVGLSTSGSTVGAALSAVQSSSLGYAGNAHYRFTSDELANRKYAQLKLHNQKLIQRLQTHSNLTENNEGIEIDNERHNNDKNNNNHLENKKKTRNNAKTNEADDLIADSLASPSKQPFVSTNSSNQILNDIYGIQGRKVNYF